MATKPSSVPTWATVGADIAEPTTGRKELGHVHGESPTAQEENWFKNLVYQWAAYLRDGALTGNHTFGGTVGVTGLITATAGLTAAANQHITVSGTGRFKHGDEEVNIAASAFTLSTVAAAIGSGTVAELNEHEWLFIAGATHLTAPLMLPVGSRVKSIDFICDRGGNTAQLLLRKRTGSTTSTIATGTAAGTGLQANTMSAINYTVEASYRVWLKYQPGGTGGTFEGCRVTYDRP